MDKILVRINAPLKDEKHDVWLPKNKTIYNIIILLAKNIYNADECKNLPRLYNRYSGMCYDVNLEVKDTDIENGTELIFI